MTSCLDHRRVPATPAGIAEVDSWLEQLGERWRLPATALFRARVCVSEIAANALEHGGASAENEFAIVIEARDGEIRLEWCDDTRPFDLTAPAATDGDGAELAIGGRGLSLVRAYSDRLTYARECGRNIVRMLFPTVPCPVS